MRLPGGAAPRMLGVVVLLVAGCRTAPRASVSPRTSTPGPTAAPQRALPQALWTREVTSHRGVVVTGSPEATWAGLQLLEAGGNAVDGAVAAAFALGVAEPGSSGLGGQTYMVVVLSDGRAMAIDGACRAPLHASHDELQRLHTENPKYFGYKLAATPGSLAALAYVLERYGTRTLPEVLAPAIAIAEYGSVWQPLLRAWLVEHYTEKVRASPCLCSLFLKDCLDPWEPGHHFCNPDLACFLRRLGEVGADDFYRGEIAGEIEEDMIRNGGWLRRSDLGLVRARERPPLRGSYRGLEVLSFPSPGGGATVVETLNILDRFPAGLLRADSLDRLHLLIEAERLALADSLPATRQPRTPDELAVDSGHSARRAALIRFDRALSTHEVSPMPLSAVEDRGTTHISVADASGNAVSLTQTLGRTFGCGAATPGFGFAYNSFIEGFDFSDPGSLAYMKPGQTPKNSMSPTIVLRDGRPFLVLGSSGSERIPPHIVDTVVNVVDRGMPLCEATCAPRAIWGGHAEDCTYLEIVDPITTADADALRKRGFDNQDRLTYPAGPLDMADFGGVNVILVDPANGTLVGVGDPRRWGVAAAAAAEPAGAPTGLAVPPCWRSLQ
jgi:gamma-glutamyltranspeptidase / glutathione hydrolase